jgi:quinoprotein dehydrogenase-associated probable ABC transporter substrate-binding protein
VKWPIAGILLVFPLTLSGAVTSFAQTDGSHRVASQKAFEDLSPDERNAAKAAARTTKLSSLRVCADPGNMPFSNEKGEGFENKIAEILGQSLGAPVAFFWRPILERGLTRETFDNNECDILMDMPADYEPVLTTVPIYRTTYVLAYRTDRGLAIKSLDDPKLKELRIGVFQQSSLREVLARHGIKKNVDLHIISHDADLVTEHQPWHQVQQVVDGELDVAGVWGPFAGWLESMRGAPLTIQPVNLMEDDVPLQFDLAIGMRRTDAVLKFMLDDALERSKDKIKDILTDYGVPLVRCSRCVVTGDLPSHGSYANRWQERTRKQFLEPPPSEMTQLDMSQASPDQIVSQERLEDWLREGADLDQELSNAVLASDRKRVEFLLKKGAHVNKRNLQGLAPMHVAARQRDSDMLALLADHHGDVNGRDSDDRTPLIHAVFRNHVPSVRVLLSYGAELEAADPNGYTPLSIALEEGNFFAASALLEAGASVTTTVGPERLAPLMLIASQPQVERRAASLAQGPGSVELAKELIARGADINTVSGTGVTALMIAAARNNSPMIALLVQQGANRNAETPDGKTALDIARENSSDQSVKALEMFSQQGRIGNVKRCPTHRP